MTLELEPQKILTVAQGTFSEISPTIADFYQQEAQNIIQTIAKLDSFGENLQKLCIAI